MPDEKQQDEKPKPTPKKPPKPTEQMPEPMPEPMPEAVVYKERASTKKDKPKPRSDQS
jgi:hypothetical protein